MLTSQYGTDQFNFEWIIESNIKEYKTIFNLKEEG